MRRLPLIILLLSTSIVLADPPKVIEQFDGKVIGVTDGDTASVLVGKTAVKVRLEGIDAPESGQSYGTKSKVALSDLIFGKQVTVKKTGEDRYGRTLGVIVVEGVDANAKMIEKGFAWHFKKYNDEERLEKLEEEARKVKVGLWAVENAIAPWDYRARKKKDAVEKTDDSTGIYWLNTASGTRHNSSCEYFKNTKRGRVCEAVEGKACGLCGG